MVTSLVANPISTSSARKSGQPLASEFRLLGLRPREARLDVIRGAVKETAGDLKAGSEWDSNDSSRVARVAVAGYRLLDPRRRGTFFERVQLLLWTEDELETPSSALWDVPVDKAGASAASSIAVAETERVVASPVSNPVPPPVVVPTEARASSSAEETQAALELFRTLRKRDRRAMALWVSIAALALSLVSTLGLVAALI